MRPRSKQNDVWRAGLAIGAAVEAVIVLGRSMSDADKRDTALAVAMGVLHGCCGPNGDFTSEHRPLPRQKAEEAEAEAKERGR
jgi:hypothetical protein